MSTGLVPTHLHDSGRLLLLLLLLLQSVLFLKEFVFVGFDGGNGSNLLLYAFCLGNAPRPPYMRRLPALKGRVIHLTHDIDQTFEALVMILLQSVG